MNPAPPVINIRFIHLYLDKYKFNKRGDVPCTHPLLFPLSTDVKRGNDLIFKALSPLPSASRRREGGLGDGYMFNNGSVTLYFTD